MVSFQKEHPVLSGTFTLFIFLPHSNGTFDTSCFWWLLTVQFTLIMNSNHQKQRRGMFHLFRQPATGSIKICMCFMLWKGNAYQMSWQYVLASSMSHKQKNQCVMFRTKYPASAEETVEQLRPWVEKGKAWAQATLGDKYYQGLGVDQSLSILPTSERAVRISQVKGTCMVFV